MCVGVSGKPVSAAQPHIPSCHLSPIEVTSLEILTASGDVVKCGRDSGDPDLFKACLCNIGALGIVTVVTIQCEPFFNLREIQSPNTLDNVSLPVLCVSYFTRA